MTVPVGDISAPFTFLWDQWDSQVRDNVLQQFGYWGAAMAIASAIGLPVGVWLGHLHRGSFVAINTSNIGRALPTLGVLAVGIGVFGLTFLNIVVAFAVLAIPPILTNAYVGVDSVDPDAVEAAKGMGMRPREVLVRVELPLALPLIFAGLRTSALFVMATIPIAAIVGGKGLGEIINNQASFRLSGVIGAGILVIVLALGVNALLGVVQRLVTPRGLRLSGADSRGDAPPAKSVLPTTTTPEQ